MIPQIEKEYTIVVFDFDNTLIKRNTLLDFFYQEFGLKKFIFCFMSLFFSIFQYVLGAVPNYVLKEKLLIFYLSGMKKEQFEVLCTVYKNRLNKIVNKTFLKKLVWHKAQGHQVVIISASLENWILPWAKEYSIEVLATQLEEKQDVLTGKISGKNCYGEEKVRRLLEKYPNRSEYTLYAYGDGGSDVEMLKFADHSFRRTC